MPVDCVSQEWEDRSICQFLHFLYIFKKVLTNILFNIWTEQYKLSSPASSLEAKSSYASCGFIISIELMSDIDLI